MKKIQVEVCVCTACVMNGSIDIMDSVESLRDLRQQMNDGLEPVQPRAEIEVTTNKCLGDKPHQEDSPMVANNGKVFPKADAESVMSSIIDCIKSED